MLEPLHPVDWAATAPRAAACLVVGYLLGSIPFGLIFSWLAGAGDVRKIGSGNIGATNVLRTGKKWAAAATLLCDAGKGAVAVLVAGSFGIECTVLAGVGAFLGHIFPVWLKFRGGKGFATFLGVTLAFYWPVGLLTAGTWLIVAAIWRFSSLSALIAAAATPIYFAAFGHSLFAIASLVLALLIVATHRENIARLARGQEPRIGNKASAAQS
ncbi:MAG TPA: glycerol-3-phosphate 1-O-acyltransferase PlsY [Rhizomicrobium sp.]|jgi:glycerol-3-phosphate acyltransferase PlsY|nr:glycerol-3-phosphate 1-O-acyltransferase PlsY [Rhizomicrobium sp.]